MKFKRLPQKELDNLQEDFISYLVVNGITADDWEVLLKSDVEKADGLIDSFSDVVYAKVMEKIEYVDHRTKNEIKVFYLGEKEIEMIGIEIEDESLSFLESSSIEKLAKGEYKGEVKLFKQVKPYSSEREIEVFEMLEKGCFVVDARMFNIMKHLASNLE